MYVQFLEFTFPLTNRVVIFNIYQIDYETAAESQRRELASKLTDDFLNHENGVSALMLTYCSY